MRKTLNYCFVSPSPYLSPCQATAKALDGIDHFLGSRGCCLTVISGPDTEDSEVVGVAQLIILNGCSIIAIIVINIDAS